MDKESLERISNLRRTKGALVFTNGCFDILHVGHARYLQEARALGGCLVVGLNTDASIQRLKGSERPIVPQDERRELLLALEAVDEVVLFNEDTPIKLIEAIKPDFLVKGGDWAKDQIVGSEFVEAHGGTVLSLPFHGGKSTTNIVEKIRRLG